MGWVVVKLAVAGDDLRALGLSGASTLTRFLGLAYLPALAKANKRVQASAERQLAAHVMPTMGQEPLSYINVASLRQCLERMMWTPGVRHTDLAAMFGHLKRALALAVNCGLIPANPCEGLNPEPRSFQPGALGDDPTVSQFAMWCYLPTCRSILRGTANDVDAFSRFLMPAFGGRPIRSLTAAELGKFLSGLKGPLNALMYARVAYALEGVCALAAEKGYLAAEVWDSVDGALKPRRAQQTRRVKSRPRLGQANQFLSKDEATRVMAALKADSSAKAEARILLLVMLTGAALGEVARAKWAGFDPQARTLKAGASGRVIYLSAQAADFIASLGHGKSPWLFPNAKSLARPCPELAVRRYFEGLMVSLGLEGYMLADLRVPYVRFLFERQVPAGTVAKLTGLEPADCARMAAL